MKTPDEIKNGLGDPVPVHFHGGNPEPHLTQAAYKALEELFADALALIQQLEAERDALLKYLTNATCAPCDICKHDIDGSGVLGCKHIREHGVPCFEWRGVQKEVSP